jgi:sulfite exporter TauE/SafE
MTLWTALLLGLVGSLHCAGMCGPLALALPAGSNSPAGFFAGRLAYNFGRIITYCLLGLVFGLLGRSLFLAGIQRWVSISLGLILLIGLFSSRRFSLWRPVNGIVETLKRRMACVLRQRSLTSLAVLGLLNGLLPCGLVYVACAGATASGAPGSGVQYMAAFGLGTFPMMLGIGLSGRLIPVTLRLQLRKAIPVSVFLLAALLILRGLSLNIPYISPNLSASNPSCCQK